MTVTSFHEAAALLCKAMHQAAILCAPKHPLFVQHIPLSLRISHTPEPCNVTSNEVNSLHPDQALQIVNSYKQYVLDAHLLRLKLFACGCLFKPHESINQREMQSTVAISTHAIIHIETLNKRYRLWVQIPSLPPPFEGGDRFDYVGPSASVQPIK